jgi:hypothetical protein
MELGRGETETTYWVGTQAFTGIFECFHQSLPAGWWKVLITAGCFIFLCSFAHRSPNDESGT